ncbi:MAG: macrolide-specific efflux protein [uncultured bacterium]|nr:MAG: macrolide-specific efflux protein [uncultured bacterium]
MMKQFLKITASIFVLCVFYGGFHHHYKKKIEKNNHVITVASHPFSRTLYYSGVVQPLKTVVVTAFSDGVIENMAFHYGDVVKEGQLLFSISSEKFQTDYKVALMQYIKAKTDFVNNKSQMQESEFLHKNQLISDDDYKAKKINYYNAQLVMIEARDALDRMMKQIDLRGTNMYDLNIEDVDKISHVLHTEENTGRLHLLSPVSGVVLLPNKDDSADGELKNVMQGDQVKQGDVLAVIGDTSGLKIHINVSEFNINQLKMGQKVEVTGAAFPNFTLEGEITAIDRQGHSAQSGLPIFPVDVTVLHLSTAEQDVIHMGMSAKVAILIENGDQIIVPIQAVFQKNGQSYVKVEDKKTGAFRDVLVTTGQTTLDSVVIESKISAGENIVLPH